jgi:plastocyanin
MLKKKLLLAAASVLLVGAGCAQPAAPAPTAEPVAETAPAEPTAKALVNYTAGGFDPQEITVPKGTQVIWKNMAETPVWVASAPHPIHTDYAGFDEKAGIGKDKEWAFTFDRAGDWKYHNHLNPTHFGTVHVTE